MAAESSNRFVLSSESPTRFLPPDLLSMHEDLLGYLLGALEPEEMQRVSEWLRDNPEGQRQLAELEQRMRPLDDDVHAFEGPSDDLLARTLAGIPDGPPPATDDLATGNDTGKGVTGQPDEAGSKQTPKVPQPATHAIGAKVATLLSDVNVARESGRSGARWSMVDSVGGLLSVATLLALLLPSIAAGRFEARKHACQDHLRQLGTALMQYVSRDPQNRLPQVAASGLEAYAGIYSMRLADAGLLPDPTERWCPSLNLPVGQTVANPASPTAGRIDLIAELPAVSALSRMSVNDLQRVQQFAGGNYAYSLGVIGEHGYSSPRFEARTAFAVMADAPLFVSGQSSDIGESRYSHGGQGINILYEDGAVRFVRVEAFDALPDHPLRNHRGMTEAGVNIDDASLAPSPRPPFSDAPQR